MKRISFLYFIIAVFAVNFTACNNDKGDEVGLKVEPTEIHLPAQLADGGAVNVHVTTNGVWLANDTTDWCSVMSFPAYLNPARGSGNGGFTVGASALPEGLDSRKTTITIQVPEYNLSQEISVIQSRSGE
jgi:hypothetical protein